MKKLLLSITLLVVATISFAQTFTGGTCPMGTAIPDNNATGVTIPITVSGLTGQLGIDIWFKQMKLHITHSWLDDLDITLIAPDTYISNISSDNGGSDDNFGSGCGSPTIFSASATTNITAGTPPYVGMTYGAEGSFYFFHITNSSPNGTWNLKVVDDEGANAGTVEYVEIEFTTINSVNEYMLADNFSIYPNPSSGQFTIKANNYQASAINQIEIHNVLGEKIYSSDIQQTTSGISVDFSSHPSGIYFLLIKTEEGTATKKLIIQ